MPRKGGQFGTPPIIAPQVGAVNQNEGGGFCAECTKNDGFLPQRGLSHPCPIGQRCGTQKSPVKQRILAILQRKTTVFTEKPKILRLKLPFYDINGNKIAVFEKIEIFCATSRNEQADLLRKRLFFDVSEGKIAFSRRFRCILLHFQV
jgi:hypothetical protein